MQVPTISPLTPRLIRAGAPLLVAGLLVATISPGISAGTRGGDPRSSAQRLWATRYNGPADRDDSAYDLGVSPDGSTVFATGHSWGGATGGDYATVAYDAATGAQLWATRYNGPGNLHDGAFNLGVSPDGSTVFATGVSDGVTSFQDYATVAYDAATGAELWSTRYNGPGNSTDEAKDLRVSPDGSQVFVTGDSGGATDDDYATVAYDAATGAQLWATRYDGPGIGDTANAVGVSIDGSTVFVTGSSNFGVTGDDYVTVAYDAATGVQLWATGYNGPGNGADTAYDLGVSPDGSTVFVTGFDNDVATVDDYATVAYDAVTGAELWATRYTGPGNSSDYAFDLGVSPDGSTVFATGRSWGGATGDDYATVAYDAVTGAELWATRYNDPGNGADQAYELGVSPDGSTVFVTGLGWAGATGFDYTMVAYDAANGAQLWVLRARARGSDSALALAVNPVGSTVFVTGWVQVTADGETDYGTIAYAT